MKVHISNAYELLVAAAFCKGTTAGETCIYMDLSLFLYRYDDYIANKRLRMVYALIISLIHTNVIVYATLLISGIISVLTNPLHVL